MFRRNNSIHELEKEIRTSATLYLRNRKESKSKDGKHGYFVGLKKKKTGYIYGVTTRMDGG